MPHSDCTPSAPSIIHYCISHSDCTPSVPSVIYYCTSLWLYAKCPVYHILLYLTLTVRQMSHLSYITVLHHVHSDCTPSVPSVIYYCTSLWLHAKCPVYHILLYLTLHTKCISGSYTSYGITKVDYIIYSQSFLRRKDPILSSISQITQPLNEHWFNPSMHISKYFCYRHFLALVF